MFGSTTRRLRADLAAARAENDRLRDERDEALSQQATAVFNRAQILRHLAGEGAANVRLHGRILELGRRNSALTESDPEYAAELERKVSEVLEEHDVHRKALADALGEQKRHLNWDALIGEAGGLAGSVAELQKRLDAAACEPADGEWRGRARRAEKDVERLRKELDNACGMPPGGLLDSAVWQPGYVAPKPDTKAAS